MGLAPIRLRERDLAQEWRLKGARMGPAPFLLKILRASSLVIIPPANRLLKQNRCKYKN
jgi:hypothetical protein